MRSRPELQLYLLPKHPHAGTRLRAEAVLESGSETPIEGVEFHLTGIERRHSGTSMVGKVPVAKYATVGHVNLFGRTPATTLSEGKHTFVMTFELPPTLPPSFRSNSTTIEYTLTVRVVIPWWPDKVARYAVEVGAQPRVASSAPVSYCTDERGPRGTSLYIEASMDRTAIGPGDVVTGAASIGNVDHHRIRRVELAFVAMERVAGTPDSGDEVERYTIVLHEGAPADSKPIPFRVKFPEKATPSFRGSLAELRWRAEIRAVIALGSDISLSIPLDIVAHPEGASPAPAAARVPPVGRERRAMVWAAVAQRHGLDNDAAEERMRCDLGGGALEITLEPRREGGLATVARLRFPSLGIGLTLGERRWTDAISWGVIATGDKVFDERFTVRAREEAQVQAFLDQASRDGLRQFERASIDDGGATFERTCAAQATEELHEVVGAALTLARTLLSSARNIPPPAAMSSCVPQWRELAELTNGRLQIGCMAIREAVFNHHPFELVTEWGDDGGATGTVARLFLANDEGQDHEVLRGPAAEIASALSSRVHSLNVASDCVEATFAAPLHDPRAILPTLEGLGQLVRAIEGKTSKGPYR